MLCFKRIHFSAYTTLYRGFISSARIINMMWRCALVTLPENGPAAIDVVGEVLTIIPNIFPIRQPEVRKHGK